MPPPPRVAPGELNGMTDVGLLFRYGALPLARPCEEIQSREINSSSCAALTPVFTYVLLVPGFFKVFEHFYLAENIDLGSAVRTPIRCSAALTRPTESRKFDPASAASVTIAHRAVTY